MTETPDLSALARRYLDLWQDQLKGLANDRETAEVMARTLELMTAGAQAMAGMTLQAAAMAKGAAGDDKQGAARTRSRGAAGAEAAGAASRDADDGVDELARRLAGLERRVAALEAGPAAGRPGPKKRPRNRKS